LIVRAIVRLDSVFTEKLMLLQPFFFRVDVEIIRFLSAPKADEHGDYLFIKKAIQTNAKSAH
jgi:hypothetical protein